MKRVRATVALIALSSVMVLVAPLASQAVAPAPTSAAPVSAVSASVVPTRAFVRVDGGTAYAKKISKHRYTVRAPKGAKVGWMGEADGKPKIGSFTPERLTNLWPRLGYRADIGAQSVITWRLPGDDVMSYVDAQVSNPRINNRGELIFTARAMTLPKALPEFSINMNPVDATSRGYGLAWPISQVVSNSFGFSVTATADHAAQVVFQYYDTKSKRWVLCPPTNTVSISGEVATSVTYGGVNCNGVRIQSSVNTPISLQPVVSNGSTIGWSLLVCGSVQFNNQGPYGTVCWAPTYSWQAGGTNPSPAIG